MVSRLDFFILNTFYLILSLKKILLLVNDISFIKGICLSYFLDKYKNFTKIKDKNVKNFYFVFIKTIEKN